MLENLINDSVYNVFKDSSLDPVFYASKIISIALGLMIAGYAYKIYKLIHSQVLFGIILSFGFTSLTDVFIILILPTVNDPSLFNLFFWMRLFTMAYSFTFLALTYRTSAKELGKSDRLILKISALSTIPVLSILLLTWFFYNSSFPSIVNYDIYFRVYNLCALGYVFVRSFQHTILEHGKKRIYLQLAYSILLGGQISLLFFRLDGSVDDVFTAFVAKDLGLAILAIMAYYAGKSKLLYEEVKPHMGWGK